VPPHDGNLIELSFGKLTTSLAWLFDAVDMLSQGQGEINKHLASSADVWRRLEALETREVEPVTIVQDRAKTPPRPKTPQQIEIPYVPSEQERAEEARKVLRPMLEEEVAKLLEKVDATAAKIKPLEEFCARENPWDRTQTYMQEIGFLPYGEPEEKDPLVNLGQVLVLLRQDINMCPKIKDLEDAKDALNARINEVESAAAADCEARAVTAAAEAAKLREDAQKLEHTVGSLVEKNEEDGDVAGGLRDIIHRADTMEERRFPKIEQRVRNLEEIDRGGTVETGPKKKGPLDGLGVDLEKEIQRLRGMIECIESAMPYETRQTMQFFHDREPGRRSSSPEVMGNRDMSLSDSATAGETQLPASRDIQMKMSATTGGRAFGGSNQAGLANFRMETQEQLEQYRQKNEREQMNLMKNLRENERKLDQLESKVLDMYKKLPKVLAVLEPLQGQLEMYMNAEPQAVIDSTGGQGYSPALEGGTGGGPGTGGPALAPMPLDAELGNTVVLGEPTLGSSQPEVAIKAPTPQPATVNPPLDTAVDGAAVKAPLAQPTMGSASPPPALAAQLSTMGSPPPPPALAAQPLTQLTMGSTPPPPALAAQPLVASASPQPSPAPAQTYVEKASGSPTPMKSNIRVGSFTPLPEGAAGTGEGGVAPNKEIALSKEMSPMAQMGSLTNLIKVALHSTTNDIHLQLRQEHHQFRTELLGNLDGKANKSELVALASRLDALMQKTRKTQNRFTEPVNRDRERSLSPRAEQGDTAKDANLGTPMRHTHGGNFHRHEFLSSSPSEKTPKKTCHDRCKEPTAPRSLQMSQSLSRLPALKSQ